MVSIRQIRLYSLVVYARASILARDVSASPRGINFCFRLLLAKGLAKLQNFSLSKNKRRHNYFLALVGLVDKLKFTAYFLTRGVAEYEFLKKKLGRIKSEMSHITKRCQ